MRKYIIIWIILTIVINCEKNKNPISPPSSDYAFAIYFLQDENLKMNDVYNKDLRELKLSHVPWLCNQDIRFYDWSSHLIYLKEDKTHLIPGWQKGKRFNVFPVEWADKPFVVTANGKKCYLGYFSRVELSTQYWIAPMMEDIAANNLYPLDVVVIDWIWLYHDTPQNNQDVKNALINSGLYHGGISVTFDTTDAILNIENADTSTITYKFTITNNDEDNLYVLDPDKIGSGLFHRFTNGPVFKNLDTGKLYESRWKKTVKPAENWSPDWFTKLKSGQSIQRTVVLKGYPFFPTGEYIFEFKYSCPPSNMENEARELSEECYWLGVTRSNILVMVWEAENESLSRKNVTRQYFLKNKPHRIYSVNSPHINEYSHITPTQQQFELKRR
jgi:hypothetical protein